METRQRFESPLNDTRTDPAHHQLPIQAVKIWLDLAINTMQNNDGIIEEDIEWFKTAIWIMQHLVIEEDKNVPGI
jgi:hypothetical protein